jgi:hypothetical protein
VSVPNQENELSCICVLGVSNLHLFLLILIRFLNCSDSVVFLNCFDSVVFLNCSDSVVFLNCSDSVVF